MTSRVEGSTSAGVDEEILHAISPVISRSRRRDPVAVAAGHALGRPTWPERRVHPQCFRGRGLCPPTVTINGGNFGANGANVLVTLNNLGPLDLLFLTPTQIVANLSALVPLAPGNYRLTVTNLKNGGGGKKRKRRSRSGAKHDDFELAVGAQGPSGADGADGADGATGPPGTAALVGLQCPPGEALVGFSADLVGNVVLDCTPFPAAPLSAFKVLVTSSAHTVNLGGLAGADASCQGLADAAGLDGTFTAWLSDSTTDARDRLPTNASWSLVGSGALVASDLADLTKGSINAPINEDETGSGTFGPDTKCGGSCPFVLTGTLPDGTGDDFSTAGDRFCNDWTAPLPGGDGHRQVTGYRTLDGTEAIEPGGWTRFTNPGTTTPGPNCSAIGPNRNAGEHRLYCFQTAPVANGIRLLPVGMVVHLAHAASGCISCF